ncbi:MAG: AAA family ATPase [Lachnospiraceae bacterium]|nr:AAA family ATPase [Lachnospiraceae bacterium]
MTIQDAKEEIKRTVKAYHQRDENGKYKIPVEKQRPLFLMGPPGIGKTAIVEQVAEELKINLISYTITHHTRQSAIGLPFISRKKFGEKEYAVTEYTMSEIVASVYEQIERSGIQEGILFLDEINAVSETLSPTMLQFLQYKTFGMHRVPEGFVIVTAGNPAEFNKSVRDFDIATLDRLRQIDIEEDFQSFKDYAYQSSIHSAILSYLEIKKDRFYFVRQDIEGKHYVTARSWEDLSKMLYAYEELHYPIDKALCMEYLSDPELAEDFSLYYSLYQKYKEKYHVPEILRGNEVKDKRLFLEAPFDEKWSLLSLLNAALQEAFRTYAKEKSLHAMLFAFLKDVKVKNAEEQVGNKIEEEIRNERARLSGWREARILSSEEEGLHLSYIRGLENFSRTLKEEGGVAAFSFLKAKFQKMEEERQEKIDEAGKMLSNALRFLGETFGEGQEMILFLTELVKSRYALLFLSDIGNDTYNQYNQYLLLKDKQKSLQEEAGKWIS